MEEPVSYVNEDGDKTWYLASKGKYHWHRLDGPAVEWANGTKYWYLNDQQLQTNEVETWLEENNVDLTTEIGQMAFKLRWS